MLNFNQREQNKAWDPTLSLATHDVTPFEVNEKREH